MNKVKLSVILRYIQLSLRWCFFSITTGIICGMLGTGFSYFIQWANEIRGDRNMLIFLLPVAGLLIVRLYHMFGIENDKGTDLIFDSVRNADDVPIKVTAVSFLSTVVTHLCGGSAGRVGVAMQMGGGIAANLCRIFKLNPRDRSLFIMCGMSGLISVLFGTPLMATFLSMEVISIGVIYYAAFLPCLLTSLTAFFVSELFGITPMRYTLADIPALNALTVVQVAILAVACGVVSILFCGAMKLWGTNSKKYIPNQYYRILFGSLIVVVLTLILGTQAYNGSSAALLNTAINYGTAHPLDFAFKLILTAITLQSGFKGGAVFPALVIGATFGCQFGALIGIDPCFSAAIGMIAVFCGSVNCPIASILFAAEVFGGTSLVLFAIAVAISFVFSGYFTIFPGQHFIYSKLRMEYKNSGLRE